MNAIYARQSVDKKDSLSIEGQVALCRRLAGNEAVVFADRGYSGKNTRRPEFMRLVSEIESGKVGRIFVYRLDRFSRSISDFGRIWELLEKHNVDFVSVTENFDTSSPMGRAMLNIVLVFAQLERETTAERVRDNYLHRAALGAWPGGPAPFGFDIVKLDEGSRKISALRPNGKADIVRMIFDEYARDGASLRSVARLLSAAGIHGPQRESWDNVTLSRILRSPLYVMADFDVYLHYLTRGTEISQPPEAFDGLHGCNLIGKRKGGQMLTLSCHEGFIPSPLWLTVQDKLADNRQLARDNAGRYSWLTGLLKCGRCGYAVKINHTKADGRLYLLCSGRSNLGICESSIHIDIKALEEHIWQEIGRLFDEYAPEISKNIGGNADELFQTEQKIHRLVSALSESGGSAVRYISDEIERLEKRRQSILKGSGKTRPHFDLASCTFAEKKLIAAEFIEKICLDGDNADILWKF